MAHEDILEWLADIDEPRTTPQVADAFDISKPAAWNRLTALHEQDLLDRHQPGELSGMAWSVSDRGREQLQTGTNTETRER